jgi:hypothetical protein
METKNAIVKSVGLSNGDHGCLSAWLHLDYGGSGQGFGGFMLYSPKAKEPSFCGHFIWRCLEIAGVTEWNDIPGKSVRVKCNSGLVTAIGHIVKDDWFDPKKEIDDMQMLLSR